MKKFVMGSFVIALLTGLCVPSFAQGSQGRQHSNSLTNAEDTTPCQIAQDAAYHDLEGVLRYVQERADTKTHTRPATNQEEDFDAFYHDMDGAYTQDYVGTDNTLSAVYELKLARSYDATDEAPAHRTYIFMVQGSSVDASNKDNSGMIKRLYGVPLSMSVTLHIYAKKDLSAQQQAQLEALGQQHGDKYRVIDGENELAVLMLPEKEAPKMHVANFEGAFFLMPQQCGGEKYLALMQRAVLD